MPRRVSVKGKGAEIFYPDVEEAGGAKKTPAPPAAAPPAGTAAAGRKPRASKLKETPLVKTPAVAITFAPPPTTPAAKTPAPLRAPLSMPPPSSRTPPPASLPVRPAPQPAAPAGDSSTPARYDRLSQEIDTLYEIAARKVAAGRGVGQSMQWLRDARRLVMSGRAADFAQAELMVRHVGGLLKHGDEVDDLYAQVLEQVGDSPDLIEQCMSLLHQARKKIMKGNLNDLIEAEFLMEEVKSVLMGVQKSRTASSTWGTRALWVWLMGWLVIFLAVFIFDKPIAEWLYGHGLRPVGNLEPASVAEYMLPWLCLLWGAVGSVFDTLVAINEHMAKRTYDGHYLAQGFASPMYGALLGTLFYFLVAGGVVAISTGLAFSSSERPPTTEVQTTMQNSLTTAARSVALWTIAFLAGFFHKRTLSLLGDLFDQILGALKILPGPKEEAEPKRETAPPPPPSQPAEAAFMPGSPLTEAPSPAGFTMPPVTGSPPAPYGGPPAGSAAPLPVQPPDGVPLPPEGPPPGAMDLGDL